MLHILLLILKIIGILIAVVLGLLLVTVLIVLFVPIRYRLEAKKYSEIEVRGKATWLFGLVHLKIFYLQEKLSIVLRICGYRYYDNNDTRDKKDKKKNRSTSKKRKESKPEESTPEEKSIVEVLKSSDSLKSKDTKNLIESKGSEKLSIEPEQTKKTIENEKSTKAEKTEKQEDSIDFEKSEILRVTKESEKQEVSEFEKVEESVESKSSTRNENALKTVEMKESMSSEGDSEESEDSDDVSPEEPSKEKQSKLKKLFSKWKGFVLKIKNTIVSIFLKIKNLKNIFGKVKDKLRSIWKIISNLWDKKRKVVAFFQLEENKEGIKVGLVHLWEILRHIGPTKTEGYIRFGTGDPASTGQALGIAAALYGYYGKYLTIEPDFEQEILEGEVLMKGRIRMFHLLIIGIKLLREEKLKRFIKNAKRLKEELL